MTKILIIDNDLSIRESLEILFQRNGYDVRSSRDGIDGMKIHQSWHPHIVILAVRMPFMSGFDVLDAIKLAGDHTQVILITAYDDMESAVKAMQHGAYEYIEKPLDIERLLFVVKKALENQELSINIQPCIEEECSAGINGPTIIGKTQKMREIYKQIGQVSKNLVTVLIQGESGTGKELVARAIHSCGVTKESPFIGVNCSALPESLLESELFGHVSGSFTGAIRDKKGKFELADEGTIFLDEISDMSHNMQAKLLRVLQERSFEPVGGEKSVPMKARIIAASNQELLKLVHEHKFREDLYYRLNVFQINIPPLRERKNDIPLLVIHFLKKINSELKKRVNKIPYEIIKMLQSHEWVGNVRELENTLLRAIVLSKGDVLEKEHIHLQQTSLPEKSDDNGSSVSMSISEMERMHICKVLENNQWDKRKACSVLCISKATLYNKIKEYNLQPETKKTHLQSA